MNQPQTYIARLEDKFKLNDNFVQYKFELVKPNKFIFTAGQYVSIKVSDAGERRSYSICSSPEITHGFELLVDHSPAGLGCTFLAGLQFGQELELLAPLGVFSVVAAETETELAFVATGSGIAPFRSMLLDRLRIAHDQRQLTLYWGMRHANLLFWENEFAELAQSFANFHFHPVISQAETPWPLCRGRVTDCLNTHKQPAGTGYYLCGNAKMIADVSGILLAKGVQTQSIHHEKFY